MKKSNSSISASSARSSFLFSSAARFFSVPRFYIGGYIDP